MPVEVSILTELPAMHMLYTGTATMRELRASIAKVYALPDYKVGMPEICDLRYVTQLDIGFDQMLRFAEESKAVHQARGIAADLFIIAPHDTSLHMASMFELLSSTVENSLNIHIVQGYPEIFAALDLPPYLMVHLPDGCLTEAHLLEERMKS